MSEYVIEHEREQVIYPEDIELEKDIAKFKKDNCTCKYEEELCEKGEEPSTFFNNHGCCETCFYL